MCCKGNYQHKFDENLKERFFNTYRFLNHDHNKYILSLHKGNKTSLPEKEDFYSHLNVKDFTDAAYALAKGVCKDFEIKILENIMICMFKVILYC